MGPCVGVPSCLLVWLVLVTHESPTESPVSLMLSLLWSAVCLLSGVPWNLQSILLSHHSCRPSGFPCVSGPLVSCGRLQSPVGSSIRLPIVVWFCPPCVLPSVPPVGFPVESPLGFPGGFPVDFKLLTCSSLPGCGPGLGLQPWCWFGRLFGALPVFAGGFLPAVPS